MIFEISRFLVRVFLNIRYKIIYIGKENIPQKLGFIAASNHVSNFDPPLVGASLKGKLSIIAKSELFENKFFGWLLRKYGAFPVVRGSGDNEPILHAIKDIKEGKTFMIFPEGTRSKDGTLGRAKSGVVMIASQVDAPVLPIAIKYSSKRFRAKVYVAFGEVIPSSDLHIPEGDRKALKAASSLIMGRIQSLLDAMP